MTPTVYRQMLGAELLKLRRNRAVMAFALLLTSGIVVIAFGYSAIQHASNPAAHPPAGGVHAFNDAVRVLALFFGALAAILIGTEAGTVDLTNGVFRDLVATGRSRLALFAVRVPAAIIVSLAFAAVAYAISLIAVFAFAGGEPTPSLSLIVQSAGWIAISNAILATLAVGVGSLTASRPLTLTAVIGWHAIASNLLVSITSLGSARDGILNAALTQIQPITGGRIDVTMATGVAVTVLLAWTIVPIALGTWRTQTRDA
jgi:hypothetical protein